MPNYTPPPDWTAYKGLLIPPGETDRLRTRRREEEKALKGMFFSNYALSVARTAGGAMEPTRDRPSLALLKWMGRNCVLDATVIGRFLKGVLPFMHPAHVEGKQLGFRVVHQRYNDPNFRPEADVQRDIDQRCRETMHRLGAITPSARLVCGSVADFAAWTIEERLSIDRAVMVKVRNRDGRPVSYHPLPAASILPRAWYLKEYVAKWSRESAAYEDEERAAARLSEQLTASGVRLPGGKLPDLSNAAYVQVLPDGSLGGAWKADELSVRITRRYTDFDRSLFGYSPVEQSMGVSWLWNMAWDYQKQLFSTTWPEALLVLHGEYSPDGLAAFKDEVLAQHGNSQRLPVIAGGPKDETSVDLVQLRNTPTEMMFPDLLKFMINLKCAAFSLHPSAINFASDSGSGDAGLPQDRNFTIQLANEDGIRNELRDFFWWLTRELVWPWYDDLVVIPEGLDMVPYDQLVQRELSLLAGGAKTKDEVRANLGMPPMEDVYDGINLGAFTGSQSDVALIGTINMLKQAQAAGPAQPQMNPPGMSAPAGDAGGDYGAAAGMPQAPGQGPAAGAPQPGASQQPVAQTAAPPPAPTEAQKSFAAAGYLADDDGAFPGADDDDRYFMEREPIHA